MILIQQPDWRLTYDKSKFLETGRYSEALAYCKRLDEASQYAKLFRFGTTPEGRPMVVLALSKDKAFTPVTAATSAKPLILIINGIHPGEIEGKDADLILARNILINKKEEKLLDKVNLLIVPVFNVDGHERFGSFNRINQNGPKQMGWRVTSQNLNLNRDFAKADAPEMRAMLGLIQKWKPDFFFDNHTTDGGDWQYSVSYAVPMAQTQNASVAAWTKKMVAAIEPTVAADGFKMSPYFGGFDQANPSSGLSVGDYSPRYSTGYGAAINRPTMLVETHMLKPYKVRVEATYSVNKRVIEFCGKTAAELRSAGKRADMYAEKEMEGHSVVLEAENTQATRPFKFLGYEMAQTFSEVSGAEIRKWNRSRPITIDTVIRDQYKPTMTVVAPYAYAIPPQWSTVIDVLKAQGIRLKRAKKPLKTTYDTFRFENITFPNAPFEGRFMPTYKATAIREERVLPAGTVVALTAQPLGKLLMHLLEPAAPDSLAKWGFFNATMEEKEFFEDYAMEPIARQMLANNPELRAKFNEALKDPAFANSPRQRLAWFYDRSRFFDKVLKKYPVVRLSKGQTKQLTG